MKTMSHDLLLQMAYPVFHKLTPHAYHISFPTIPPHLQLISFATSMPKCTLHSVLFDSVFVEIENPHGKNFIIGTVYWFPPG